MTFWHSLVSFNAHFAHFPSPVMVTEYSAATVRAAAALKNNATPATNANDFFMVRSFRLGLVSAIADWLLTALRRRCSKSKPPKRQENRSPATSFEPGGARLPSSPG